jgi:hypothetical protein
MNIIKYKLIITCVLFIFGCLNGCAFLGHKYNVTWQEEIQLDDKKIIWVEKSSKGVSYYGFGAPGGYEYYGSTLALIFPLNGITFPKLYSAHKGILIDFEEKTNTLSVVTMPYCTEHWLMGRPNPPYVVYQSVGGEVWKVVPLESRLIGRTKNLMTAINTGGEQPKHVYLPYMFRWEGFAAGGSAMPGNPWYQVVASWRGC